MDDEKGKIKIENEKDCWCQKNSFVDFSYFPTVL
jgi:hypothetical protein